MISKKRAAISLAAIALAASGIAYLPDVYKEHKAKQAVRERLKDPSSAVFERLEVHKAGVCGFVNAKNEMGGYVGHKAFFYTNDAHVEFAPKDNYSPTFRGLSLYEQEIRLEEMKKYLEFLEAKIIVCPDEVVSK